MDISGKDHTPSGLPQLAKGSVFGSQRTGFATAPALGPSPLYLIMNKPKGYVCSAVSDSHKTVYQLLPPELQALVTGAIRGKRLHTIGRLDADTTGLLLFTTDGKFSHHLTSPDSGIEKTYDVELESPVDGPHQEVYVNAVGAGALLPAEKKAGEEVAGPGRLTFLSETRCRIVISEGKFHQVRRTFMGLGNKVKELQRKAVGKLELPGDLAPGQFRELSKEELNLCIEK